MCTGSEKGDEVAEDRPLQGITLKDNLSLACLPDLLDDCLFSAGKGIDAREIYLFKIVGYSFVHALQRAEMLVASRE